MQPLKSVLFPLVTVAALASCQKDEDADGDRDPCLQPTVMVLKAVSARRADTGTATVDTTLPFAQARTISDRNEQYIYNFGRAKQFSLRLSQVADSCRFAFRPDTVGRIDTLTFYYDRQLRFMSNACGYATYYDLKGVRTTTHAIDSVILLNPSVTNDVNPTHLRIYY